jgi:hypothetical protein
MTPIHVSATEAPRRRLGCAEIVIEDGSLTLVGRRLFWDLMIPKLALLRFISQREDLCAQVGGRLEHFHFYSEQSS